MQKQKNYHQLMDLIEEEINLPSPPAIAVKILNSVQQDQVNLAELAEVISVDPALTAKMLKVANSGLFNCSAEISNIKRAISILGTNLIKNIALSFVIADKFSNCLGCQFDFNQFWRRSATMAASAEVIVKQLGIKQEDIFVAALLQDIGMLLIALSKGEEYSRIIQEARNGMASLTELEIKHYQFDHQQVGYALLTSWKFPALITEPLLNHHHPEKSSSELSQATSILHCADQLASLYTGPEKAAKAREVQKKLGEYFALTEKQAATILDQAATASCEIIALFELDPGDIRPYSQLLQEANTELARLHLGSEQLALEMKEAKEKAERLSCELQDANTRLKELVYRDGLTGLYNHRYFQESLAQELARAKRYNSSVSLIIFDIDHFKQVNDTHGHPAGDLVLTNIARAISTAVRPSDIVARYGGEEFAVILPETSAAGVKVFAARLRRCIEGIATLVDGQLIYVTISAGASTFSRENQQLSKGQLIDSADRGLYQSKQNGRNQVTLVTAEVDEA
jgi:diguanylate cyclase (GGDEF)-like protein